MTDADDAPAADGTATDAAAGDGTATDGGDTAASRPRTGDAETSDATAGIEAAASGSFGGSLRRIRAIARAERTRDAHRHAASRRKKALIAMAVAAYLPILAAILFGVHAAGAAVADGELPALLELARWTLPGSFGLFVVFGAIEARKHFAEFGARELHLTAVSDRELALGLLLSGARTYLLYGGASILLLFAAFAYGAGTPVPAVVGPIAAVTFVAAGAVAGYAVGLLVRLWLVRVPLSPRTRSLLKTGGTVGGGLLGAAVGGRSARRADGSRTGCRCRR